MAGEESNGMSMYELADHFLMWLDDQTTTTVGADNWHSWRTSFEKYPNRTQERHVREFLQSKGYINKPGDIYLSVTCLMPPARIAISHPGGPIAFWREQDDRMEAKHQANLASVRVADAVERSTKAAERADDRAGLAERGAKRARTWAIVASIAAALASGIKIFEYCQNQAKDGDAGSNAGNAHTEADALLVPADSTLLRTIVVAPHDSATESGELDTTEKQ